MYFKETANVFDALIVITSLIELPLNLTMIRYAVYLLYWYKSTNADAKGAARCYDTEVIPAVCEEAGAGGMGVLRSFRLMRVLRIGKLVCLMPYAVCRMSYAVCLNAVCRMPKVLSAPLVSFNACLAHRQTGVPYALCRMPYVVCRMP